MSDDILVRVEGISKKFCRNLKRSLWYGVQDLATELWGRPVGNRGELRPDEFWAVRDVSFTLRRGECLGLIGRNGAGKTTLLRMLNGLIKPDTGRIEIHGRVGALIALGAGFNPVLTGRENIYVNAAVLGLSKKETDSKYEEIVAFAELGEFIDSPVKNYSSGMYTRLGFAVAAHLNPDVLLVDEALAVGDLPYTVRCLNRVSDLRKNGTAVIFVSHNEIQVREAAQQCMLFHHGRATWYASLDDAFLAYNALNTNDIEFNTDIGFTHQGPIRTLEITTGTHGNSGTQHAQAGEDAVIYLACHSDGDIEGVCLELRFWNSLGQLISTIQSTTCGTTYLLNRGSNSFRVRLKSMPLSPGRYRIAGGFRRDGEVLAWSRDLSYININKPAACWPSHGALLLNAEITQTQRGSYEHQE